MGGRSFGELDGYKIPTGGYIAQPPVVFMDGGAGVSANRPSDDPDIERIGYMRGLGAGVGLVGSDG